MSDTPLDKPLDKSHPPGTKLKVRVIGFRLMDALASVTAKPSITDKDVLGYGEIYPGMPLGGTVTDVEHASGLLVEVGPGMRALVPVIHMSDLGTEAARKKFKVGLGWQGRAGGGLRGGGR